MNAPPYYVDGFLTQLAPPGSSSGVAGVVVGEMKDCDWGDQREASDWARSRSLEDVLEEHLEPLGVPVLYKLPLGHGKHLAALPLGVRCTLDADPPYAHRGRTGVATREVEQGGRDEEGCAGMLVLGSGCRCWCVAARPGRGGVALEERRDVRLGDELRGIDSLNPFVAFNQDAYSTFKYIYPDSSSTTPECEVHARLREVWKTSKDGKTWTFTTVAGQMVGRQAADGRGRRVDDQHDIKYKGTGAANAAGSVAHIKRAERPTRRPSSFTTAAAANVLAQVQQFSILPQHIWSRTPATRATT